MQDHVSVGHCNCVEVADQNVFNSVDAKISFPSGLNVAWQDKIFGELHMNTVSVTGDVGATLNDDATFDVVNVEALTEFTKVCLICSLSIWCSYYY
jgi:hypothetical protein